MKKNQCYTFMNKYLSLIVIFILSGCENKLQENHRELIKDKVWFYYLNEVICESCIISKLYMLNHKGISIWATIQTGFIPETAAGIAAACAIKNF